MTARAFSFVWLAAFAAVATVAPVAAQLSTKPSGGIHGRMTHVDRHPGRHCRHARGRFVACAKRPPHGSSR